MSASRAVSVNATTWSSARTVFHSNSPPGAFGPEGAVQVYYLAPTFRPLLTCRTIWAFAMAPSFMPRRGAPLAAFRARQHGAVCFPRLRHEHAAVWRTSQQLRRFGGTNAAFAAGGWELPRLLDAVPNARIIYLRHREPVPHALLVKGARIAGRADAALGAILLRSGQGTSSGACRRIFARRRTGRPRSPRQCVRRLRAHHAVLCPRRTKGLQKQGPRRPSFFPRTQQDLDARNRR